MGLAHAKGGTGNSLTAAVFILAFLIVVSVPATAAVYDYVYAGATGTVRSPSVTLQAGTSGSSVISPVEADAATLTATASLKFYESANAATNSVAIDGSNSGSTTGRKASLTVSITTSKTNDIIYLLVSLPSGISVSSVSDASALSWNHRQTEDANSVRVETWYAVSSGVLSGDVVTVSASASTKFSSTVFGVSGTNTASPFDPGFSSALVATGSGTSGSISLTTSNANDLIVAGITVQNGATVTATSPLALVAPIQNPQETDAAGYDQVTSVQSSAAFSFSWGGTNGWSMIADAFAETIPSVTSDSNVTSPGTSGSFTLPALSSAYVWTPAYSVGSALYNGNWTLDYWGSGATAGTLNVAVYVVNSANAIASTLVSLGSTASFGTTKGEVVTTLTSVPGGSIPANGMILLVLTAPKGGPTSFTIYWGAAQLSNFQTPSTFNYVLAVHNTGTSPWNVNLATSSSQTTLIGRLTATLSFVSPASNQIVVAAGSLSQSSGSAATLASSGTISIELVATASAMPTSSNTPSVITFSVVVGSSSSTVFAQYTVVLTIN